MPASSDLSALPELPASLKLHVSPKSSSSSELPASSDLPALPELPASLELHALLKSLALSTSCAQSVLIYSQKASQSSHSTSKLAEQHDLPALPVSKQLCNVHIDHSSDKSSDDLAQKSMTSLLTASKLASEKNSFIIQDIISTLNISQD